MGINTFPAASSSGVNYSGGSQASRPAAPATGSTFFNTTDSSLEIYSGTTWETIQEINNTPTWVTAAGSLGSVAEGDSVSITVSATDAEGTAISYTSANLPSGLTIGSSTGIITGTAPSVTGDTTFTFDIVASDGPNQASRQFTLVIQEAVSVQYLVVAGGGSGAATYGGSTFWTAGSGAGAGGFLTGTKGVVPATNFTVTVGAGGAVQSGSFGLAGSNSVFSTITSLGGGAGAHYGVGEAGGSGSGGSGDKDYSVGGGTQSAYAAGAGTAGQGFAGGAGYSASNRVGGGGGGGANAVGGAAGAGTGGNGGAGKASSITGSSVTYAGGGGGGATGNTNGTSGSGGAGGGGAGGSTGGTGTAGTANTGGGGGSGNASASSNANINGGAGGSGIVILKYADTLTATIGGGLTASTASAGGFKVTSFTAGTGNVSIA